MSYDPNDGASVREQRARGRLRARQRAVDWAWLVADPHGQRILAELTAPLLASSYSSDALAMARLEGQRDAARALHAAATGAGFNPLAAIPAAGGSDAGSSDAGGDTDGGEPGGG